MKAAIDKPLKVVVLLEKGAKLTGSNKILIVEDYTDIATIYSFMLEANGYTVQIAKDGPDALEKVLSFKPDAMLLDIMIPKLDGLAVLQKIRSDPAYAGIQPKILMTTNLLQQDTAEKAKKYGADGYVVKANIQNDDLITIIKELMERPAAGTAPTVEA
jgi:CheY-like chemotaxis protein